MAILALLGLIVLAALVLAAARARHDDSDDDDHSGPGGRRPIRIRVDATHTQRKDRGPR
jgi:hypothetical protein